MRVNAFLAALLLATFGMSPARAVGDAGTRASGPAPLLRVDQGGYLARQAKFAILMARSAQPNAVVQVLDVHGHRVGVGQPRRGEA